MERRLFVELLHYILMFEGPATINTAKQGVITYTVKKKWNGIINTENILKKSEDEEKGIEIR
jgi:hypothetical protein